MRASSRRFQFSLMTDAVVESITQRVFNDERVRTTLREVLAEEVAAHLDAAELVAGYEATYAAAERSSREPAAPPPPQRPQLPNA